MSDQKYAPKAGQEGAWGPSNATDKKDASASEKPADQWGPNQGGGLKKFALIFVAFALAEFGMRTCFSGFNANGEKPVTDSSHTPFVGDQVDFAEVGLVPEQQEFVPEARAPHLKFMYCIGWGYKGSFMQVKNIVEKHATERILVTGEDYPAAPEKQLLAKVLGYVQMLLMALIICGDTICKAIGIEAPAFVKKLQESQWMYGFAVFFLGNNI